MTIIPVEDGKFACAGQVPTLLYCFKIPHCQVSLTKPCSERILILYKITNNFRLVSCTNNCIEDLTTIIFPISF